MTKIKRLANLHGQTFGRLLVLDTIYSEVHQHKVWRCKCQCGNIVDIPTNALINNRTRSCGCLSKERRKFCKRTHGETGTVLYKRWAAMKARCKENCKYSKWYSDRDISVCDRWNIFENFKSDMEETFIQHFQIHGSRNTTLERIDSNQGYSPDNCKWATFKEQACNKRTAITLKSYSDIERFLKELNKLKKSNITLDKSEYTTLCYNCRFNKN